MKTISNRIIRKLNPCYDPSEVIKDENEELSVKEWVAKYRNLVRDKSDIIWLLCNKLYMSEKDLRLFAVWCAREALKLVDNPDPRSITACDVAEKFANGESTIEELNAAWDAAEDAAEAATRAALEAEDAAEAAANATAWAAIAASDAASAVDWAAAFETSWDAAKAAAWADAADAARDAQIDQLMTYF